MMQIAQKCRNAILLKNCSINRTMSSASESTELLKSIFSFMYEGPGFDSTLKKISILDGGEGRCLAELKVCEEHLNRGGGLHGGLIATIVDSITTLALMTKDNSAPGVTVDLNVSYLKGARIGDVITIDANTLKAGKNLAFLECVLKHADGSLIAKGTQTKFIG